MVRPLNISVERHVLCKCVNSLHLIVKTHLSYVKSYWNKNKHFECTSSSSALIFNDSINFKINFFHNSNTKDAMFWVYDLSTCILKHLRSVTPLKSKSNSTSDVKKN